MERPSHNFISKGISGFSLFALFVFSSFTFICAKFHNISRKKGQGIETLALRFGRL